MGGVFFLFFFLGEEEEEEEKKRSKEPSYSGLLGHSLFLSFFSSLLFSQCASREHEECTKVKNVNRIELGKFQVETWYFSPLPPQFNNIDVLYFCEFDLHFFKRKSQLQRHLSKVESIPLSFFSLSLPLFLPPSLLRFAFRAPAD